MNDQIHQLYSLGVRDLRDETTIDTEAVSPCPICQCQTARAIFSLENMIERVMTCEGCGLGRLLPLPNSAQIANFYPDVYYGTQGAKFEALTEWLVRLLSWRRARFLADSLPPGARVLDVGCGRGTILSALARLGCEAHGIERNSAAIQGLTGNVHIRLAEHLSEAAYPDAHFQLVVLWHVLEHLPDLRGTLTEIHRLLAPGGRLVVAVPNFSSLQAERFGADWFHLDPPRHLYHIPSLALRQLLETCGFEVRSEHHFSLRHNPFGCVQSWLNRFPRLPRNGLYILMQKHSVRLPFPTHLRLLLRLMYYTMMPCALLLSIRDALVGRGATVHMVAVRQTG